MTNSITPTQIKQNNKKLIYQYIYDNRKVSQQNLCIDLNLSRPTVTSNLAQLEASGMVEKAGQIDSGVAGRKAIGYSIVSNYRVSIGVEIAHKEVKMMALDLYGERIERVVAKIPFENSDQYYRSVCIQVLSFINRLDFSEEQILGICFSMQGLVSSDGRMMVYGKILNCTNLSIEVFEKYLPYPCKFIHDSDSAAVSELWANPELKNAFFISVNKHIGGAIIRDREIMTGKHGHTATFEHITVRTDERAKRCYCGKYGCVDTILSLNNLIQEDEELEDFFQKKTAGDIDARKRWEKFLDNLSEVLNMLHLIYDTDFILGGYLAPFLDNSDLDYLYNRISQLTAFEEENDFLQISKMPKHSITIGGALTFIQDFLKLESLQ